ncbi:phage scaffolding protein [Paenibacillus albidus]|uniref:phage scaffolding protein n=1 Tax=Paenibacillus albidus TaxID=2041023 RepID=UPI001BEA8DBD|nr:phage scaffolding protein [Paenibacillus albidus]MBT2287983.1 phage scaffolding protein [Paenibacillus albidus]
MDWLKAILKAAGLDDLKIEAIAGDAGKELPKHFVPKSQYNDVSEAKKKLEKDITDRDTQLETLSKDAGASETLKAEIARLQSENKTAADKYAADLQDMTLTNAIKSALNGKVHNEKVVTGMIDKNKLVIGDDGKVVGLDEQLKGLQTSDAYLFKPEDQGGNGGGGGFRVGGGGGQGGAGAATNEQLASIFGVADSK